MKDSAVKLTVEYLEQNGCSPINDVYLSIMNRNLTKSKYTAIIYNMARKGIIGKSEDRICLNPRFIGVPKDDILMIYNTKEGLA